MNDPQQSQDQSNGKNETELSEEDRKALDRSDDDVRHGRFASESEVQGVFGRFRQL